MFRKPKKSAKKAGMRRTTAALKDEGDKTDGKRDGALYHKNDDGSGDDDDDDDRETTLELQEARKRAKLSHNSSKKKDAVSSTATSSTSSAAAVAAGTSSLHHYDTKSDGLKSQKELATATNEYHSEELLKTKSDKTQEPRNKFLAGPIRAAANIRTTSRFDYQPDICKDYKDTGFCGFGDTCIYLHDRGDTLSGWQLEQKWQQEQSLKKKKQEQQMDAFLQSAGGGGDKASNTNGVGDDGLADGTADDGIPFACFICRGPFNEPIVTSCGHYFCQSCLQRHFKGENNTGNGSGDGGQCCPVCQKDTHGVMNQPTKLLTKKRKLLGRSATWQEYKDRLSPS
eukprot:CAMPEP_0113483284 /NCGR_PEP_ID=MMETSP0014_2-20120614/23355_1 /TAXON_ID=2857 /ORGANISM="Nitzschia sp." /LENGTH=340 /DNA_ID=CAMNT_0000376827 /DNA_START=130 /DNA_END=1152 /DNA_ORIENTATION=+ /assembly_acc=CAM_ASM_000159